MEKKTFCANTLARCEVSKCSWRRRKAKDERRGKEIVKPDGRIRNCQESEPRRFVVNALLQGLLILLGTLTFLPGYVTGLQCFECLSLHCASGVICESIKSSIAKTFVPNSHYIHFDPRIICPGPQVSGNGSEWEAVAFNCSRSDSLCLEAPVEVITSFQGLKNGKQFDPSDTMLSIGLLRGCASRRGLKELPGRTISVRRIYMDNETIEEELQRLERMKGFGDSFQITSIQYHEIYVDHGSENATRCYHDGCNNRKKLRTRSEACTLISPTIPFLFALQFLRSY